MGKKNKSQKQNSDASVSEKDAKSHDRKGVISDERFAKVHSDPRFQKVPKHKAKVAIGSRFSAMLTNKLFAASSAPLDKRGKRKKGSSENALHRYYSLEDEDNREEEKKKKNIGKEKEGVEERRKEKAEMKEDESDEFDSDSDLESGDEVEPLKSKSKVDVDDDDDEDETKDDFANCDNDEEEVDMENDATSSTTDSDDEVYVYSEDDDAVEVENVPTIEKETNRLAIVNMDWRHVKAADLFVVLSSFLPKGGQILSVSVYPSEFGIKRMEEEALRGPAALFDGEEENKDKDIDDDDDDDEIDDEKLRAYEKSRLRYYYAVVVCDSVATADYLYKSCDGVEFERSSNVLDVRFIPDDMEFKHPPRDQATEAPTAYEGLDFHTRALQHSNVHVSWDEDEPHRVKTLNRKFNADQLADLEMKEFLASDESESEEDVDEADLSERKNRKRDKYRALIQSGGGSEEEDEEDDERQEMEVTFNTGLESLSKKILEKDSKSENLWETHLRKRKEKHKKRSKDSSDDESDDFSDRGAREEEPDDFFEEEPPSKKTKKKISEIESMEREKEAPATEAELALLVADGNEANNNVKGYKIKREKAKWKKGKREAMAEDKLPAVNLDDPRFAVKLNKPLFSLDPTHSEYKRSATYARWVAQQSQKDQERMDEDLSSINKNSESEPIKTQGNDEDTHLKSDKSTSNDKHELSMLVKSVKMKSKEARLPSDNAKRKGSTTKKQK